MTRRLTILPLLMLLPLAIAVRADAGASLAFETAPPTNPWSGALLQPPDSEADPVDQETRARIHAAEKELRRLRARCFGSMRKVEIRQMGLLELRRFDDPVYWPSLLRLFEREKSDVREAVLDIFEDAASDAGDAALMWQAVFDDDQEHRTEALQRVLDRHETRVASEDEQPLPDGSKRILAHALRYGGETEKAAAAKTIRRLRLIEAIPLLITAQAAPDPRAGDRREDGSLAWILIGRQQAYVADVTPVVGDGVVAFDPELAIVTSGTVMRIIDAAVIIYHTEVHAALIDLSSDAWGRPTDHLGWDVAKWKAWYEDEFLPHLKGQPEDSTATASTDAPSDEQAPSADAP
ncbi:MAG: hypothetical protein RIB32_02885 [Phycisphaerales bacterium]